MSSRQGRMFPEMEEKKHLSLDDKGKILKVKYDFLWMF